MKKSIECLPLFYPNLFLFYKVEVGLTLHRSNTKMAFKFITIYLYITLLFSKSGSSSSFNSSSFFLSISYYFFFNFSKAQIILENFIFIFCCFLIDFFLKMQIFQKIFEFTTFFGTKFFIWSPSSD